MLYGYSKYKNKLFPFRCGLLGAYSKINMTQDKEKNYVAFHVTGVEFVRPSECIFIDDVSTICIVHNDL